MPISAAPASTYVGTSEGRIVTMPASSNSSLRSLARTSAVSTPSRSSRSSVSPSSEPRGTARRRPSRLIAPSPRAPSSALADARDVQALDVQRPPAGGQVTPEAAEEVVVAPAPAQRGAERGVVDLEHRAGVVAERVDQTE